MKKIILILVMIFGLFYSMSYDAKAAEKRYCNLLDMSQINYDESTGVFSSNEYIYLQKNTRYSLFATSNFYGTAIGDNGLALDNKEVLYSCLNASGDSLNLNFKLNVIENGLHYATIMPTEDCRIIFTDLLTRGYDLNSIPIDELIFYQGSESDFQGFRVYEDFSDYEYVLDTISIYTNYDSPLDINLLKQSIKAYDNSIGFLSDEYISIIEDSYTNNYTLGEHKVIFEATDCDNNKRQLEVLIYIIDKTAPTIIGDDVMPWDISKSCPTIEDIRKYYRAEDKADSSVNANKIYIFESELLNYSIGKVATYAVTLACEDISGNIGYKNITVSALDTENPIVELQDITINMSELGSGLINSIPSLVIVSISDNSGQYKLSYLVEEVSGDGGFKGSFKIRITAKDYSGNTTIKYATVTINDDIAPEFYIESFLLETSTDHPYSIDDLKLAIRDRLDARGIVYDNIQLISCDYLSNEKNSGEYQIKYAYSYQDSINYEQGIIKVEVKQFNYLWLTVLIIPILSISAYVIYKVKKKA